MSRTEFIEGARETARRFGMDLSRPLALVSGGPDSVALLGTLVDLGGEPTVLHVEHGLRGEESLADAEFVRSLCAALGVPCEVRSVRLTGGNLQAKARRERYRLAEEAAERIGATSIAVGHTASDVAETVLMNLARGAGLRGLAGIPPVRGDIVRPLIERTREEVLAYLDFIGQPYRTDSTNLAGKYARNRVRLEVMPVLEELYPGASRNLARAAGLARDDLEALEEVSAGALRRRGEEVVLVLDGLVSKYPALLRHAVRAAYREVAPEEPPPGSAHVRAVVEAVSKRDGTRALDLPGGVIALIRNGREIAFHRGEESVEARDTSVETLSGETKFGGWRIVVREARCFSMAEAKKASVAYLDAQRGPFRARMAREGDTIRPLGLGGTKKVFRAMMDRKVPKDLRRKTPVVVDGGGRVAWVFGGELDERCAVSQETEKILRLEVEKL